MSLGRRSLVLTLLVVALGCGDVEAPADAGANDLAGADLTGVDLSAAADLGTADLAGTPLTPVFFSDWRTVAGGMTTTSTTDNNKWDFTAGGTRGEVIPSPTGFPGKQAMRIVYHTDGFVILRHTGMPVPAIGTTRNYRWYYRHDQLNWPMDNTQHPIQDGNAEGDISWSFNTDTLSASTWRAYFGVQVNSGENPFELARWYTPTLMTGTVYRIELQIHRTGDTTFQMHARGYDAAGALLYDDDDFSNQAAGGTMTLAGSPTFAFNQDATRPFYNADTLNGLNAGCNGITGVTQEGFPYAVQAAFAVVDGLAVGSFIGPYGTVAGEVP
jgi:hypothetical protein